MTTNVILFPILFPDFYFLQKQNTNYETYAYIFIHGAWSKTLIKVYDIDVTIILFTMAKHIHIQV